MLATLKQLPLATLNVILLLFLYSLSRLSACVSLLVILVMMLSDSPCERTRKWETCPILKEDRSLMRVAGASVTKTVKLGVSRATVSEVMLTHTSHGK
jgi:hypothetical protein